MLTECRAHLRDAGEGYLEHLRFAALVGGMLIGAGIACVIHALVPAFCTRTASRTVERLGRLFNDRSALPTVAAESSGALTMVLLLLLALPVAGAILLLSSHWGLGVPMVLLTLAVPVTYLVTNPGLDAVE